MAEEFNTQGMLDVYLFENGQLLERLQEIVLEQKDEECFDEDSINEIFRAMHTIKGSSGVMMFDEITKISHKLEDVFFYLRESKPDNVPHIELVEHVLQVVDFISSEMIKIEGGGEPDGSAADYLTALDAFLAKIKGEAGEQQKPVKENVHVEPKQFYIAPMATAASKFYKIYLTFAKDLPLVNVHAYKIVYALKDIAEDILHYPEDVVADAGAADEIAELLGLPELGRTESFDISNTAGFASVASMVVFENGRPNKAEYRKFRIKTVQGSDDYASMREVLTRRFSHGLKELEEGTEEKFSKFPDLILMDGGKGQVNIAEQVLAELGIAIPVCGMVKDDKHRTRGLYFHNEELPMNQHGEGFRLLTRIQDETHRFAIEYHRSLRGKEQVHSILDEIESIGPTRRRALMKAFGSQEAIRAASEEELAAVDSMNAAAAHAVYTFFQKKK